MGKFVRTLEGHDGLVRSLALSPDGRWLVTAGRDGKLLVWEFAAGKVRAAMDEGVMGFQVVAFSPEGKTLATGGIDRNITLWDFDRLLKDHAATEFDKRFVQNESFRRFVTDFVVELTGE
jgi:WD40 repeat protein